MNQAKDLDQLKEELRKEIIEEVLDMVRDEIEDNFRDDFISQVEEAELRTTQGEVSGYTPEQFRKSFL